MLDMDRKRKKVNSQLSLVNPKFVVKALADINTLKVEIKEMLQEIPLTDDPELVLHVCKLVESASCALKGSQKEELVIAILTELLPILNNERSITDLRKLITFVCNHKLVHGVSVMKKINASGLKFFCPTA
jgi:hypothetical protein